MPHKKPISPLWLAIQKVGYNRTRLQKEFAHRGDLSALAKVITPEIRKMKIRSKFGAPVVTETQVVNALWMMRDQPNKKRRGPQLSPPPVPPPVPSPGGLFCSRPDLEQVLKSANEAIDWLQQATIELHNFRSMVTALLGSYDKEERAS